MKKAAEFSRDITNVRVLLHQRLAEHAPKIDAASIPGEGALAKRYWFLLMDPKKMFDANGQPVFDASRAPVATFGRTRELLVASGLSPFGSFMTSALSHLLFARKTQRRLTAEQKTKLGLRFFDIYVPNMIDAQGESGSRIFASRETAAKKGIKPGDVDIDEYDWVLRQLGMRMYLTARDFERLRAESYLRDKAAGRGSFLSRLLGKKEAKRRHEQLMELYADRVEWEEDQFGRLVPAISKERYLEVYRGNAQYEVMRDRMKARQAKP
jgi:hypothetical protein